jgi:hypothetical protein
MYTSYILVSGRWMRHISSLSKALAPLQTYSLLVWTPCLMHRCVCVCVFDGTYYKITTTNYISKTSLHYHIPHVSILTLAAENLDVCTACDPWDNNIQLTMVKGRGPGPGMPFPRLRHMCREGGLFISAKVFFPVWCHPWMDDKTDGWMKKASRPRRPLLYVIIM